MSTWLFTHLTTSITDFNSTYLAATPPPQYPESNDNTITQLLLRHLSNPPALERCCLKAKLRDKDSSLHLNSMLKLPPLPLFSFFLSFPIQTPDHMDHSNSGTA